MTSQAIFFYIGILMIVAFIAFVVWAFVYFMRQDIRGVLDDLSGKTKQKDIESRAKESASGLRRETRKQRADRQRADKPIDIFSQNTKTSKSSKATRKASKGEANTSAQQVQQAQKTKKSSQELFANSGYTTTGELANSTQDTDTNSLEAQDSDTQVINDTSNIEFDFEVVESYVITNSQIDLLK